MTTPYALTTGHNGTVLEYPYTYRKFVEANPMVSFPRNPSDEWLANHNIYPVTEVPKPNVDLTLNAVKGPLTWIDGTLTETWTTEAASAEEIAERQLAAEDAAQKSTVIADSFIPTFLAMTPTEVTTYVDNSVTDLASARGLLRKMALMLLVLGRRGLRQ